MTVAAAILFGVFWLFATIAVFQIVQIVVRSHRVAWLLALGLTPVAAALVVLSLMLFGSPFGIGGS